jgi:hypothetical protein
MDRPSFVLPKVYHLSAALQGLFPSSDVLKQGIGIVIQPICCGITKIYIAFSLTIRYNDK